MASEVIVHGARAVHDHLRRMALRIETNKVKAAHAAAAVLARAMRNEAPRGKTGRLRASVRVTEVAGLGARVGPRSKEAKYVVRGTRPHTIEPRQAQALYMQINGGPVFAASAEHPGAKANPFVHRAKSFATVEEAVIAAKERLFHDAPIPDE